MPISGHGTPPDAFSIWYKERPFKTVIDFFQGVGFLRRSSEIGRDVDLESLPQELARGFDPAPFALVILSVSHVHRSHVRVCFSSTWGIAGDVKTQNISNGMASAATHRWKLIAAGISDIFARLYAGIDGRIGSVLSRLAHP